MSDGGTPRGLLVAAFALLTLIWGTTWSTIRIGLEGIPPLTGVALRFGMAGLLLLVLARVTGVTLGRSRSERALWLANGVLAFCISYGVVYWAEQWVPSGLAAVLFATYPIFVVLLSHLLLPAERMTATSVIGSLVAFGGVAVIFSSDFSELGGSDVAVASAVMLVSPLSAAAGTVLVKRFGGHVHPMSMTAIPMLFAAFVLGGLAAVFERERTIVFDAVSVGALLYLTIAGSAVTFTIYYWLLRRVAATRIATIAYLIPIVAVLIGVVFLDEPLTTRIVAGTALVIGGVAVGTGYFFKSRRLGMSSAEK